MFDIAVPQESITLPVSREGQFEMNVTNLGDQPVELGVRTKPGEGADTGWFSVLTTSPFTLAAGETRPVSIGVSVGSEAAAGVYQCALTVYSVEAPQDDHETSPYVQVTVPSVAAKQKPPWPLIAGVAVLVILVGAIAWVLVGGDDPSAPELMPDLIALPVAEAQALMGGQELSVVVDPSSGADACIYLQAPSPGESAVGATALAIACPEPSPRFQPPAIASNLCAGWSFAFCSRLSDLYGNQFFGDPAWTEGAEAMAGRFASAFIVDGEPVAGLAGLTVAGAEQAVEEVGVTVDLDDQVEGDEASRCVLFQYPFAGMMVAEGEMVSVVTAPCPAPVATADLVDLTTDYDQTTFFTLCDHESSYCDSVEAELGPAFVSGGTPTSEFRAQLRTMVSNFRAYWADRLVNVIGMGPGAARQVLAGAGLEMVDDREPGLIVTPAPGYCWLIVEQIPAAGTRLDQIQDAKVTITSQIEACWYTLVVPETVLTADKAVPLSRIQVPDAMKVELSGD